MMARLKIAAFSAAGCGGCDIAMLEIHEHLLDVVAAADIVFWPTVMDFKYADVEALDDGSVDACFFSGSIRTSEHAAVAELLRRKSKVMVAFGSCSAFGGVPGLGNLFDNEQILDRVYGTESTDADARSPETGSGENERTVVPALTSRVMTLADIVDVDVVVPGCPPEAPRVWDVCQALVEGVLEPGIAGAGNRCVCDECERPKRGVRVERFVRPHAIIPEPDWCLLEQGIVCMGPATRSGCGARCTTVSVPCRGCYGPAGDSDDQGAAMIGVIGSLVDSDDEETIAAAVRAISDPAGTFYCFSLPASILGGATSRAGENE